MLPIVAASLETNQPTLPTPGGRGGVVVPRGAGDYPIHIILGMPESKTVGATRLSRGSAKG